MLTIEQAQAAMLDGVQALPSETVEVADAVGRALAQPVVSNDDVPPEDNSAMDGLAVQWEDMREATPETPVVLRVIGTLGAGTDLSLVVTPGCGAKIMTGAAIPPGADAVIPLEKIEYRGAQAILRGPAGKGDHLRARGADVRVGQQVFAPGAEITSAHVGVLASIGVTRVAVGCKPRVAVMATGSELVDASETPGPGKLRNSNGPALLAAVRAAGAEPVDMGIVPDDPGRLRAAFAEALDSADLVLSSGGVSVGEFDFVKGVLEGLGVELVFTKVAQKPGKPMSYGRRGDRHVVGVPGNPAAALVCFAVHVRPLIRRLAGFATLDLPGGWGLFDGRLKVHGRPVFARVTAESSPDGWILRSAGGQSSGLLLPMAEGRHLALFEPRETPYQTGDRVRFWFLDGGAA